MAKKMKLRMPPLPVSHWEEIKIFNDFIKENNKLSNSKCVELAVLFKSMCNGTTIFPKLPSMIKHYYKQWENNSLIKLAQNTMKKDYNRLLSLFSSQNIILKKDYDIKCRENHNYLALPFATDTMHVSSVGCTAQQEYVSLKESKHKIRKCDNYPMCIESTNICNGFRPLLCINVISGKISLPSKNELSEMNRLKRKETNRQNMRNKRKIKKDKRLNKSIIDTTTSSNENGTVPFVSNNSEVTIVRNNNTQNKRKKIISSSSSSVQDGYKVIDGPTSTHDIILAEETFDINVRKVCQKHGLEVIDVPGVGDCQLHSVLVSHFNEKIVLNNSNYMKLTKIKRSISNLAEKNCNIFLVHHTEKYKEWRKHYVGDNLPMHL